MAATDPFVVLYVDDDPTNLRLVDRIVQFRPEWRLVTAASGSLGIQLAGAHRPDLVLLDHRLPDVSGLEVLRSLRSHEATASTPVAFLTGDRNARLPPDLDDPQGRVRVLVKPIDIDEVLAILDQSRPRQ